MADTASRHHATDAAGMTANRPIASAAPAYWVNPDTRNNAGAGTRSVTPRCSGPCAAVVTARVCQPVGVRLPRRDGAARRRSRLIDRRRTGTPVGRPPGRPTRAAGSYFRRPAWDVRLAGLPACRSFFGLWAGFDGGPRHPAGGASRQRADTLGP